MFITAVGPVYLKEKGLKVGTNINTHKHQKENGKNWRVKQSIVNNRSLNNAIMH